MGVEVHQSPLNPDCRISIALFENVKNCKALRQSVMKGDIEVALLKAEMVLDVFQVQVAAARAGHLFHLGKMTTRNPHSEIIFGMTSTKNISDSFRRFGIGDNDTTLLLVELNKPGESKMTDIQQHVQGDLIPLSRLHEFSNIELIKKVYKIKEEELCVSALLDTIVGRIASKDFISF